MPERIHRRLRASAGLLTALGTFALLIVVGWQAARELALVIMENDGEHREMRHQIRTLEHVACEDWLQGEQERQYMGGMDLVTRRAMPRFCLEERP